MTTDAQTTGILLQQERSKLERLEGDIRQLQLDAKGATERGDRLQAAEKELTEKCREQVSTSLQIRCRIIELDLGTANTPLHCVHQGFATRD